MSGCGRRRVVGAADSTELVAGALSAGATECQDGELAHLGIHIGVGGAELLDQLLRHAGRPRPPRPAP